VNRGRTSHIDEIVRLALAGTADTRDAMANAPSDALL
jgi:hypothetical protein